MIGLGIEIDVEAVREENCMRVCVRWNEQNKARSERYEYARGEPGYEVIPCWTRMNRGVYPGF